MPNLSPYFENAIKITGVSPDFVAVARCDRDIHTILEDHVYAARSQPYYLDVTHPKANKGHVVQYLSQLLGIPCEAITAIGDMPSDVAMFKRVGLSIAMGNASQEVQQYAQAVTAPNDDDGFAKAIRNLVLPVSGVASRT